MTQPSGQCVTTRLSGLFYDMAGETSPACSIPGTRCAGKETLVIAEIECVANPHGTDANPYEYIEAAIKRIEDSGLEYEVDALGTTVQGDPDAVWALLREVHEATLTAGANSVVTIIKVAQAAPHRQQATIEGLVGKFRG